MEGSMKSLRRTFTGEEEKETDYVRQAFDGFSCLSWKQKVIGFIVSILLAATFSIVGCVLAFLSPPLFAVLFTIGTICGIASTLFLVGPISQAKKICSSGDVTASVIKISSIVVLVLMIALVFCAVFWWNVWPVAVLFCIVEFIALIV
ncbi:Vesicle transport protein SFT2A [Geodia barretti]|uniref:Vesicle transport protein n=1 Tax=Geodia barretti TaxID=519541 RepID=A0AA35XC09_GEOBA|nr:Vesicle transport protein SFT2A [Geodia barretti]